MARDLDIVERQLEPGMVKTVTDGDILLYVELLFDPDIKAQFGFNKKTDDVQFCVKDRDPRVEGFQYTIDKKTLKTLILELRILYNQMQDRLLTKSPV